MGTKNMSPSSKNDSAFNTFKTFKLLRDGLMNRYRESLLMGDVVSRKCVYFHDDYEFADLFCDCTAYAPMISRQEAKIFKKLYDNSKDYIQCESIEEMANSMLDEVLLSLCKTHNIYYVNFFTADDVRAGFEDIDCLQNIRSIFCLKPEGLFISKEIVDAIKHNMALRTSCKTESGRIKHINNPDIFLNHVELGIKKTGVLNAHSYSDETSIIPFKMYALVDNRGIIEQVRFNAMELLR